MNKLIDLLLCHSSLITSFIQGYENDQKQIDEFLTFICEDINEERIIAILNGNFSCEPNEIEQIWNFLHKYDIDIKDNFREYCVKKIYKELNYKLNIIDMTTSIMALIHNTCINADAKCIDCNMAAEKGHLDCLKYVHENGCEWSSNTCLWAARVGQIECLKYVHENGCAWNSNTCKNAAKNGQIECLKYAHENGCEWTSWTCAYSAYNGHLECLKYAHENGCQWNYYTCSWAAQNGHLECLKYAHENGCEWDADTCKEAAYNGHLDCLKYAHENGCEWDTNTCTYAASNDHLECLKYAHENGCEWNQLQMIKYLHYKQLMRVHLEKYIYQNKNKKYIW
jgi:hypothetical protein